MTTDAYAMRVGETGLLTVRCMLDEDGSFVIGRAPFHDSPARVHATSFSIVRVEPMPKPVLPTAFGSRIVADVGGRIDVELVLASPTSKHMRWLALDGEWINEGDLSNARVLHDPDATASTAEAAAPEPVELPTGLGAVVQARYYDETVVATLADPGSLQPWRIHRAEGVLRWVGVHELSDVAVLSPGIEVDLP